MVELFEAEVVLVGILVLFLVAESTVSSEDSSVVVGSVLEDPVFDELELELGDMVVVLEYEAVAVEIRCVGMTWDMYLPLGN